MPTWDQFIEFLKASTPLAAIIGVFITVRKQQQLKALELLANTRRQLLEDIEKKIAQYQAARSAYPMLMSMDREAQKVWDHYRETEDEQAEVLIARMWPMAVHPKQIEELKCYMHAHADFVHPVRASFAADRILDEKIDALKEFALVSHLRITTDVTNMWLGYLGRVRLWVERKVRHLGKSTARSTIATSQPALEATHDEAKVPTAAEAKEKGSATSQ